MRFISRDFHRVMPVLALSLLGLSLFGCEPSSAEVEGGEISSAAGPAASGPLSAMLGGYETVRRALLDDHLDGVAEAASSIGKSASELAEDFSAEAAGVPAEKVGELKPLLASISLASKELAQTEDLGAARKAFWALTEPLMKYRELAGSDDLRVAYCPMAGKSWLQPDGEIGNPYYGQSMATCGAFVEPEPAAGSDS
ncbi:MAG: DUF3347 domain-containing protein [Acidobacteria bacterium]|nr:DUF3347 domain-containing protein [Acidobacteriota bacterium]